MKSKIILLMAILMGVLAASLAYLYLNGSITKIENTKYTEVLVAAKKIEANTVLTESLLEKKKVPLESKHPLSTSKGADLLGKITLIELNEGEEILTNQVVRLGDTAEGLAFAIPSGKRAIAIPVDDISGVGGMLKAGDHVDIIATLAGNEDPPVNYTAVVLQDITVLAVNAALANTKTDEKAKEPAQKTVTLAVDLDGGLKLKMAAERGSISLMLRPPTDSSIETKAPITTDAILKEAGEGR